MKFRRRLTLEELERIAPLKDPVERGLLEIREIGGGYRQTQAGPNAHPLAGDELERALAAPDADLPPSSPAHRVTLTDEELEQLANPDPRLET